MPSLRLSVQYLAPSFGVTGPGGAVENIPLPQFRCLVRLPNVLLPKDAVIDTGAPLAWFPENVWAPLRPGIDFDWLPFVPGPAPPNGRIGSWYFTYRMARFLAPVALLDYSTELERTDVVAAFATGNPPAYRSTKMPPPVVIGLWGGLLEGSTIAVGRDPASGHVTGALAYP